MSDGVRKRPSFMNAAELMDKVFDIYKRSFFPQIGLNFAVYTIGALVLYLVIAAIALAGVFTGAFAGLLSGGRLSAPAIAILCVTGAAVLMWLFLIYNNTIASATSFLSWLSYSNRPVDISYALKNTFKSFGNIITVSLAEMISGLPVIALFAFIVYVLFAGQGVFTSEYWNYGYYVSLFNQANVVTLLLIILSAAFVVSVIYNYFTIALPVAVFDRKHFFGALVSSYRLVKGYFWRLLGIRAAFYGVTVLVSYSFSSLTSILISIAAGVSFSLSPSQNGLLLVSIILQYVIAIITAVLMMPLNGIFTSVIFFNQKIKKEGLDLSMQLEILERSHGF